MAENKIQNSIILGGLLHDIEKFLPEFWKNFNEEESPELIKEVRDILLNKKDSEVFKIISLANKFQSGKWIDEEKIEKKKNPRLVNLFPNISIKEDKAREKKGNIPLQKLVYSNLGGIFKEKSDYKEEDYKKDFKDEFQKIINRKDLSFEAILSFFILVLQKYLWCLSANPEDRVPDISLWEHSALTSAIANCIYLHREENKGEGEINENAKMFRLIIGDFSGIQKYIFDIAKMKKAGIRLKGRSFLVQLISEDIKNYILEKLGLPSSNTIICAGGKFIILVPNLNEIENPFEEIKKRVEDEIFKRFGGEIRFNLALSKPFKGDEFGESMEKGRFGEKLDDAFIELAKSKYHPFEKFLKGNERNQKWNENAFIREDIPDDSQEDKTLCKLCKKYLVDNKNYKKEAEIAGENVCQNCGEAIRLGKRLREENRFIIWKERGKEITKDEVELLFKKIEVTNNFGKYLENFINIMNPQDITQIIVNHKGKVEGRFFATYVAGVKSGEVKVGEKTKISGILEIKDFETILKDEFEKRGEKGFRKLAILKGDVDNLGKIFYFGLKNYKNPIDNLYTATRLKTLSFYLNLFFEGYIDYLARRDKRFNDLYIVFSGGDDFTIVGYWETLIDFVLKLKDDFRKFAFGNPEVHFSASLHLMDAKWPIFEEIKKAEEELEEAKNYVEKNKGEKKKNHFHIFGKVLNWDEFQKIKNKADEFQKYIERDSVSMGYLWKLHKISKMIYNYLNETKKRPLREKAYSAMWKPYLHYYTERNLNKYPDAKQWIKDNLYLNEKNAGEKIINKNIIKNLDIFTTYLLYKNRKL